MSKRPEVDFSAEVCKPFDLQGGPHGVLLIHGFTGSAAHMRLIGEELHRRGYTVKGINLPGHATSMEDMARTTWQDWLQAAKRAVLEMKETCEKVSVAGLSMGGVLSLLLAEQMDVTCAMPISAPMAVQNRFMPLAKVAALFVKTVWWGSDEGRAGLMDMNYHYGYPGFPTKCAADLSRLIHMARRNLHCITCPVLAVQSRADETISADSADVIVQGVSSEKKAALWLEKVPHVCTISPEWPNIAAAMDECMKNAE